MLYFLNSIQYKSPEAVSFLQYVSANLQPSFLWSSIYFRKIHHHYYTGTLITYHFPEHHDCDMNDNDNTESKLGAIKWVLELSSTGVNFLMD